MDSPCVDKGKGQPIMSGSKYDWMTTRTDGVLDKNRMDMGYHYPPYVRFSLNIEQEDDPGNLNVHRLRLYLNISTISEPVSGDVYLLLIDPDSMIWSGMNWLPFVIPAFKSVTFPPDLSLENIQLLDFGIPTLTPPVEIPGEYLFLMGATQQNTFNFISSLAETSFKVE